jgi:hypothetical protein
MTTTTKTSRASKTRAPIKALNQDAQSVQANAKAEKARKDASKKALRESLSKHVETPAATDIPADAPTPRPLDMDAIRVAAQIDADALGVPLAQVLSDMGLTEDLTPAPKAKTPYNGPMLALKAARVAYVKAKNGIQCNGDKLAQLCGAHTREETVAALVIAMALPGNPYLKLNPGQQSMNLRNKARHALTNGTLTYTAIEMAYEQIAK